VVYTASNSQSTTGQITITLNGEKRDVLDVELNQVFTQFQPNQRYTYLLTYPKDLGRVVNADLLWKFNGINVLNPINILKPPVISFGRIEVNYMSSINRDLRDQLSTQLCPISTDGDLTRFGVCATN